MTTFLLIDVDNQCTLHDVDPNHDRPLQALIGGDLELIRLNGGIDLYIDEDGLGKELDSNMLGMLLAQHTGTVIVGPPLRGKILVFGGADEDGNELDIPAATVAWLKRSPLTVFADDPERATWPPVEPPHDA